MSLRHLLLICCLALFALPLHAQQVPPTPGLPQDDFIVPDAGLAYGARVTGALNDNTPRYVYYFDGQRGEVVSLAVNTTRGDLDPVVTVLDSEGEVLLNRDDTGQSRDVLVDSLRITRSDRYYVVVGRFGYGVGSTAGEYQLTLDRIGVSSADGSMLRYGDSIINNITNMAPQLYYSFRAERGDVVSIQMQRVSGDLDPYLQLVDSNAFVIASNDDVQGSATHDAAIVGHIIQESGVYVVVATRYGQTAGTSTGSFVLSVVSGETSGLGNSAAAAFPIVDGDVIDGEISDDRYARYYSFQAHRNDVVSLRMTRTDGSLDAFIAIADANLQNLVEDDDGGGGQNSYIAQYLIPADGLYYAIASRYQGEEGRTTGGFTLELDFLGNVFDEVETEISRITYGTTVTGRIDDTTPQVLYAFYGVEGEIVTASMNRADGDLDPTVSILNEDQRPLVSDDDSGGAQNALIERYVIPVTGIYYVRATRYSGSSGNTNTRGSYILVLARRFD